MDRMLALQMVALFFLCNFFGLIIADVFIGENINAGIVSDNPDDVNNVLAMIAYILVVTAVFLFIVVYLKFSFMAYALEFLALSSALLVFLAIFLPGAELLIAAPLLALKYLWGKSAMLKNICAFAAVSVAGPLIGVSLGTIPVLLFIIAISLYDIFAVFGTRHMVKLAKNITGMNLAFTFTLFSSKREFELGTGDIAIPLAFAASTLKFSPNPIVAVPLALFASLFGLLLTLKIAEVKNIPLPALPLQGALMVVAWVVSSAFS